MQAIWAYQSAAQGSDLQILCPYFDKAIAAKSN